MKWWARTPAQQDLRRRFGIGARRAGRRARVHAAGAEQGSAAQRDQDLITTGQVFDELLAERTARLKASSTLLASDFALKRVLATRYDAEAWRETLASAAGYQERIGVERNWIVDDLSEFLVGVPAGAPRGESIAGFSPLAEALEAQDAASAVAMVDRRLFQLVAVPVFGPDAIGFLVLGQAIDDAFAVRPANTGSDISFPLAHACSHRPGQCKHGIDCCRWARTGRHSGIGTLFKNPFCSRWTANGFFHSSSRSTTDRCNLCMHWCRVLRCRAGPATYAAVAHRAGRCGCAAQHAGGRNCASGSITEPVKALVAGMREVLAGNLHYRVRIEREDEVGFLARAFNEMVGGLEERERINDTFGRFVSRDVAGAVLGGRVPLGTAWGSSSCCRTSAASPL